MTFNDVKKDIIKLIGLDLESVRPGAGIRILNVDEEQGNLQLETVSGQVRSRPLLELERIWNELQKSPAVHVDKVLNGSGTSRNQPETILANLPYIEWAKIHNKKHLIFVKEKTHPYGTLRQMDKAASAKLSVLIDDSQRKVDISIVIVTTDIKSSIEQFQSFCDGVITAKEQGIYVLETSVNIIAFVSPTQIGLKVGSYPVVEATYISDKKKCVNILEEELIPMDAQNINILMRPRQMKKV